MNRVEPTKLCDIGKTFDIWLVKDLQFFWSQASLGIVFPCSLLRLIELLSRDCGLVLGRFKALSGAWWSILFALLPQRTTWCYRRFV